MNLLSILFGYWSATFIHEVAHLTTFRLRRINIRALYIWPLILYKKDKKWKFKFRQINILTFGGIVIPDLHIIRDNQDLNRLRKDFAAVMIAAPITSILFNVILSLLFLLNHSILYGELKVIGLFYCIGVSICTVFITLTSCIKGKGMYGDYAAYFMLKKDRCFVAYVAYQYLCFSSAYRKEMHSFIRNKVLEGIKEAYNNKYFSEVIFDCVNILVSEYLTGKIKGMPLSAHQYIMLIKQKYRQLLIYNNSEALRILLYNLVPYFYRGLKDESKARILHQYLDQYIYIKDKVCVYYHKRNQHILGINKLDVYMRQPKNIMNSMLYQLINLFDEHYEDEWSIMGI